VGEPALEGWSGFCLPSPGQGEGARRADGVKNMEKIYKIGYGVFIGAVGLIAVVLIWSALPIEGGLKIKIVQSGSMEPAIKTGALVVIKPSGVYKEGDIITFGKDTKTEVPTTHRIVGVRVESGKTLYQTKGDANDATDMQEVASGEVIGKVLFSLPYVGYILDFAKKPFGFILIIGIPAAMIIYDEAMKIKYEIANRNKKTIDEQG